jgi:UDP-N-acetylglucosamine 2-epimerase (non-hydrolysing)
MPLRPLFVVGARPNFPKVAPILSALQQHDDVAPILVHTGQHYDPELSAMFFEDLGIAPPDHLLGVGSGAHGAQTARIMLSFEELCQSVEPDAVVVIGDVNSTVACALVAAKMGIPVAHVEAGLRSGDRSMPEELNRIVTDSLSDRLYTHCREADDNLAREGVSGPLVRFVGNVMIDTLLRVRDRAEVPDLPAAWLEPRGYGLVTLHRPALVDSVERLTPLLEALADLSDDLPLIYPVHPRTWARLRGFGLIEEGQGPDEPLAWRGSRLLLTRPLRYVNFLWLMDHARAVLTDSGGIQEETAVLGVPCITARENTERAVTIHEGTNQLVGLSPTRLVEAARAVLAAPMPPSDRVPELWDGKAGERIAADLVGWLRAGGARLTD